MKYFLSLFKALFSPVVRIIQSLFQFLNSLIRLLIELPIRAFSTVTKRASDSTDNLNKTLDDKKQKSKENQELKQAQSAIKALFRAEGILGYSVASSALKWIFILLLQSISFFTTYKGFDQFFSSFGTFIPLVLALVVQVAIFWLSGTIANSYSHRGQKWLLIIFLIFSISFSYVGASEVLIPYQNYIAEPYQQFYTAYSDIRFETIDKQMTYSDPAAQLTGEYQKIEQFISSVETKFDDYLLEEANQKLQEYRNSTEPLVTDNPVNYIFDDSKEEYLPDGGGQTITYVPNPDMKALIEKQDEYIKHIEEIQKQCSVVRKSMEDFNLKYVLDVIQKQIQNDNVMEKEFITLKTAIKGFQTQLLDLAKLTETDITISLDLDALVSENKKYKATEAFKQMESFATITDQWQQENRQNNLFHLQIDQDNTENTSEKQQEENNFFQQLLQTIIINNPNKLKELALNHASDVYSSFHNTLKHSNLSVSDEKLERLEQTYQALSDVDMPIAYSLKLFFSIKTCFSALISMVVAIFIDGISVLIGMLMNERHPNWLLKHTISENDIQPYAYSQFRRVMMTIIHRRLKNIDKVSIYNEFIDIIQKYIETFEVFPEIHKHGYSGYTITDSNNMDEDFRLFVSFAMDFGIIHMADKRLCKTCGFVEPDHPKCILLLTKKGQLWLTDMMGNASEICIDMKRGSSSQENEN